MEDAKPNPRKAQLARAIEGEISRTLSRRYQIKLEDLDEPSLRELQRLLRDLAADKEAAVRQAKLTPWR